MNVLYAICLLFALQEIPYKAKEEFEVKLNLEFRQRQSNPNAYSFEGRSAPPQPTGPLPYLKINLKLVKLSSQEVRARVSSSLQGNVLNKKVQEGQVLELDLGFTDDLKGRVASHEYIVLLLDSNKKPINRIVIFFEPDGTYLINGEKRGKV